MTQSNTIIGLSCIPILCLELDKFIVSFNSGASVVLLPSK